MAFRVSVPVRFNDVDHAGIVYYPLFFHYFHVAFEELFRERAAGLRTVLDDQRLGLPAVKAEAEFHKPLRFGDEAVVEVTLERLGTRSLTLQYRALGPQGDTCAVGHVTCAVIDLDTFQAIEVPDQLRTLFERL